MALVFSCFSRIGASLERVQHLLRVFPRLDFGKGAGDDAVFVDEKVVRTTPMVFLPYMFFSCQTS